MLGQHYKDPLDICGVQIVEPLEILKRWIVDLFNMPAPIGYIQGEKKMS